MPESDLPWLAVLDSSVLVASALSSDPRSPNRETVELALAKVFVCILSDYIRSEVTDTLLEQGLSRATIDDVFAPVWRCAEFVPLAPDTDELAGVVQDEGDRPIVRTALGVYAISRLGALPSKFLVSENVRDIPPGRNLYGFRCVTSGGFLAEIRRSGK